MPTYEYQCDKCGEVFEHSQKMTDAPLKACPFDGCKGKVKRLISAGTGVIFKGSGFYETDYKKRAAAPSPEGGCSAGASCPNSKSCPAATSE
ncbi:zinc ribbon domain-containing protein [bacterium]|nr:zinc ribbon domain-containing protein [bacterium]